jgi:hypothetical protein
MVPAMAPSTLATLGLDAETLRTAEGFAGLLRNASELATHEIRAPPAVLLLFGGEAATAALARALATDAGGPLRDVAATELLARGAEAAAQWRRPGADADWRDGPGQAPRARTLAAESGPAFRRVAPPGARLIGQSSQLIRGLFGLPGAS